MARIFQTRTTTFILHVEFALCVAVQSLRSLCVFVCKVDMKGWTEKTVLTREVNCLQKLLLQGRKCGEREKSVKK
jgi:hypothetical protein